MSLIYGLQRILVDRLRRERFISRDADVRAFGDLRAYAQSMAREGESLPLPDSNEAGAGKKVIELIEALEKRERQGATKAAVDLQLASLAAEANRRWTDYNEHITWLREFEGRNRGEWRLLTEWVGLTEDDLSDPVPRAGSEHEQYGRHPDWWDRAGRVSEATHKLRGLTPEQRAEVPHIVAERRRLAILKGHDTDIANLFDVVRQLAQRLEAIESRLHSEKESVGDVAA